MPKFECRIPDYHGSDDDSWTKWTAFDAESAAEDCAQEYYEDDPGNPDDLDVKVEVRDDHGNITKWSVTAYTSITYRATQDLDPVVKNKLDREAYARAGATPEQIDRLAPLVVAAEEATPGTDGDIA